MHISTGRFYILYGIIRLPQDMRIEKCCILTNVDNYFHHKYSEFVTIHYLFIHCLFHVPLCSAYTNNSRDTGLFPVFTLFTTMFSLYFIIVECDEFSEL